jgi:hypothetical protein
VTNMENMFYNTKAFTDQNLSSWDVANVPANKHRGFMFRSGSGNTEPTWNK